MYKRDIKVNGYFIIYLVVTLWKIETNKSQCKAAVPRDWGKPRMGVRSLPPAGWEDAGQSRYSLPQIN